MLSVFKKIWNFSKAEQHYLNLSMIFALVNAAFNALQFGAIYYMLQRVCSGQVRVKDSFIVLGILLISLAGKITGQRGSALKQTHAGYFMAAHKRKEIGEKLKKVPMGFFNENSLGKISSVATTGLSMIEMWVPMIFVMIVAGFLQSILFICSLFYISAWIAAVAIGGVAVFLFATSLMEKKSRENAGKSQESTAELTKEVLAAVQGMQVIKSYNLSGENNKKMYDAFENNSKTMADLELMIIPYTTSQKMIFAVTQAIMLYMGASMYYAGKLLLPETIMIMIAAFMIFDGLKGAGNAMAVLRVTENAIDSLDYITNMPDMSEGTYGDAVESYDIDIENIEFSYDKRKILDNLSVSIKEKELTALVGPSGSGKTTLSNLIARFWDVDRGIIKIGKHDIKEYPLERLLGNISIVFQNVYLFEDTVENNIRFGRPDATHAQVVEAAKKAFCHDFIEKLPQQYNTVIGEGGASLSGGEKQRLSIARAMLKDSPIIIFDEATANVDPENEDKLQYAIEKLTENKTVIMIAHRLKTIRNAGKIVVLNNGKVEEAGTHDELIKRSGLYNKLLEAKNKSFNWKVNN